MGAQIHGNWLGWVFIGSLLFGCLYGLYDMSGEMVSEMDAYSRSLQGYQLYERGDWLGMGGGVWLPLHKSVLGVGYRIWDNLTLTPRLLTLVFSLLTIFPLYRYSLRLGLNRNGAWLALVIYLLWPLRLALATVPVVEPVFGLVFLAAIVGLMGSYRQMLWGILLLNVAHGLRFESWLILPLFWIWIWCRRDVSKLKRFSLWLFSLLVPVIWSLINKRFLGHPLAYWQQSLDYASRYSKSYYGHLPLTVFLWGERLSVALPFVLIICAVGGVVYLSKKSTSKFVWLGVSIPIVMIGLLVFRSYSGWLEWMPYRYLYMVVLLWIPFISMGLLMIWGYLTRLFRFKPGWLMGFLLLVGGLWYFRWLGNTWLVIRPDGFDPSVADNVHEISTMLAGLPDGKVYYCSNVGGGGGGYYPLIAFMLELSSMFCPELEQVNEQDQPIYLIVDTDYQLGDEFELEEIMRTEYFIVGVLDL